MGQLEHLWWQYVYILQIFLDSVPGPTVVRLGFSLSRFPLVLFPFFVRNTMCSYSSVRAETTSGAVRRLPEAVSLFTIITSLKCTVYSQRGDSQRSSSVPPLPEASPVFIGHLKWSESGHMTEWANGTWCEGSCLGKSCNMLNKHNEQP